MADEPAALLILTTLAAAIGDTTETQEKGHGGGDNRLLDDLFIGVSEDPLCRAADHHAGAASILTGIAANRSFATGQPFHPLLARKASAF